MAMENVATEEARPQVQSHSQPAIQTQPTFIQPPEVPIMNNGFPQMMFTGPVFIGYPIEQAMAFMQQYNKGT